MKVLRSSFALCLLLLSLGVAHAQKELDARTTEVSVFKNGLGFVVKQADLAGPGEYVLRNLPVPVHGSFWLLPDSRTTTIQDAIAFGAPRGETEPALSLMDLLQANVGKAVEVRTEADGWVACTVLGVPEREPRLPTPRSDNANPRGYWEPPRAYRPPAAGTTAGTEGAGFVLLKTAAGTLALPPAEIKGVRSSGDLARRVSRSQPGAALRIRVAGGGGPLRVAYLTWGLTWAPSYQVDISEPKEASVRCKAVLINDADPLESARVSFITGYPHLAFSEAVDPLALIGDASDFLQSLLALSLPTRRQTPATAMQQVTMNTAYGDMPAGRPSMPGAGEVREDLFFYPQPDVNLRRGERGYYQLFAKRVPYDDLYLWEIEDSLDEQSRWRYGWWSDWQNRPAEEPEEVWHALRLTNAGGLPWTTAPAMTVQEGRILGQDTLGYTASGSKALLKITRALDVRAEQSETEAERDRGAQTAYGGRNFDLVTIKGELRVINLKSRPVTLLIKKTLSGDLLDATPKPSSETTVKGVWKVNPQQRLSWEVPIAANGKAYITYRYKVYASR